MSNIYLKYDKANKDYVVHTEEHDYPLVKFKVQSDAIAFIVALRDNQLFTDVKRMIEKFPEAEARAWRGALLYLDGHVRVNGSEFKVLSQPGTISYTVSEDLVCTCPDHRGKAPAGPGGKRYCKHVIATVLFYRYHQKPKVINSRFHGRMVQTKVVGNSKIPMYADGSPIEEMNLAQASIYKELVGHWPQDNEKLVSWVYR